MIDRTSPAFLSLALHGMLCTLTAMTIMQAPRFAVTAGSAPIEISFSTARASVGSSERKRSVRSTPAAVNTNGVAAAKKVTDSSPATQSTLESGLGARSDAKAIEVKNSAPVYPEYARRHGHEGVVLLSVDVDSRGGVRSLRVKKSSGHEALDSAALRAVRAWVFEAATIGGMSVDAVVEVPVRFSLERLHRRNGLPAESV